MIDLEEFWRDEEGTMVIGQQIPPEPLHAPELDSVWLSRRTWAIGTVERLYTPLLAKVTPNDHSYNELVLQIEAALVCYLVGLPAVEFAYLTGFDRYRIAVIVRSGRRRYVFYAPPREAGMLPLSGMKRQPLTERAAVMERAARFLWEGEGHPPAPPATEDPGTNATESVPFAPPGS